MFELVKTTTADDLYLHGLLKRGEKAKYAILHIHGFEGDFFTNKFIPVESNALKDNGYTFLSVQTRGTASEYELDKTDGTSQTYGSHYELLKEAYHDIDAWIEFLVEKGYHKIILQGHSLGTIKVVRYLAEGTHTKFVDKLILLSPLDIHSLVGIVTKGKYKDFARLAKQKVDQGKGMEITPEDYSPLKLSYQTFVSWLTFDHFGKMFNFGDPENNYMILNKIDIPVKAIVGDQDEYFHPSNPGKTQEAMDILKLNIKSFDFKIIEGADHQYNDNEHELAQEIILFLEQ